MTTPTTELPPPPDGARAKELADEAKTADDAPAPVHPEREREVLVRDALGKDPHVADVYGPDGERDAVKLGQAPDEVPDPQVAAVREMNERADVKPEK